jgi:hypothetical protein
MQVKILICMKEIREKFDHIVNLLQSINEQLKFFVQNHQYNHEYKESKQSILQIPFKGTELYLLHKAFIDSGGAPTETYKSLMERTAPQLGNKNQKGFSVESLQKNSDKVDYESKENVKRFLQRMIRNIDSY